MVSNKYSDLCGIDEAGRGCLAGPLVVAGVIIKGNIIGLNDSKKLTEKKRELLFDKIIENSVYKIVFVDNEYIDDNGLSNSIRYALNEIKIAIKSSDYLFDGNTTLGIDDIRCEIKADAKYPQVSASSILAKVSRDRYMVEIAKEYQNYNFAKHKGYGTKEHREEIAKFGYTPLHRRSFKLKNLDNSLQTTLF